MAVNAPPATGALLTRDEVVERIEAGEGLMVAASAPGLAGCRRAAGSVAAPRTS